MMKRRTFIAGLGGAAAWPVLARGQQSTISLIGVLTPLERTSHHIEGLRLGMGELGYTDGVNIRIEYRAAEGRFERLPGLAENSWR